MVELILQGFELDSQLKFSYYFIHPEFNNYVSCFEI